MQTGLDLSLDIVSLLSTTERIAGNLEDAQYSAVVVLTETSFDGAYCPYA